MSLYVPINFPRLVDVHAIRHEAESDGVDQTPQHDGILGLPEVSEQEDGDNRTAPL